MYESGDRAPDPYPIHTRSHRPDTSLQPAPPPHPAPLPKRHKREPRVFKISSHSGRTPSHRDSPDGHRWESAHASGLTVSAANCPTVQDSQAFLAWGDQSEYFLAPDGNFANSGASWTLTGGAGAIAGGDGYSLGANPVSTQSLALPNGSSATTPSICVGINSPTVRFMAQNAGAPTSTLEVSATVDTTTGLNVTLPIGDISAAGTWSPTLPLPVVANLLPLLPGNETPITFTFTPQGQGGHWQIDDLFVDPWTRGGGGG